MKKENQPYRRLFRHTLRHNGSSNSIDKQYTSLTNQRGWSYYKYKYMIIMQIIIIVTSTPLVVDIVWRYYWQIIPLDKWQMEV